MPVETMIVRVFASITFPPARAKVPRGRMKGDPEWNRALVSQAQAGSTVAFGPPHGDVPASDLVHEAMGRLCPFADWIEPLLWAVDDKTFAPNKDDSASEWSLVRELVRSWQAWKRPASVADPFCTPDTEAIAACQGVVLVMGVIESPDALNEALLHLRSTGPARPVCVLAYAVQDISAFLTSENKAEVTFQEDGTVRSVWMKPWKWAANPW